MALTTEELNRRCAFFAQHSLPYSDKVWFLLAKAWRDGCDAGNDGANAHDDNPFRTEPINNPAQAGIAYARTKR